MSDRFMVRKKRFWVPYDPYELDSLKVWFEEKAGEGYRLHKMRPYFAVFEESDRVELIYHIEPALKDWDKPEGEILESSKMSGWTYAGTLKNHYHIFHAPEGTPLLQVDKDAQKLKLQRKMKSEKWGILGSILAFILLLIQIDIQKLSRNPKLWIVEDLDIFTLGGLILILVSGLFGRVIALRRYKTIMDKLDTDDESHNTSTGMFRTVEIFGTGMITLVMLWSGYTVFTEDFNIIQEGQYEAEKYPSVSLERVDRSSDPDGGSENHIFDIYSLSSSSIIIQEKQIVYQSSIKGRYGSSISRMTVTYYDLVSPYFIDVLLDESEKTAAENTGSEDGLEEEHDGADTIFYKGNGTQYLILR
ncbi:DUF2812 domain-containing protein [Proteiniclasticum sp.]|uniref:DUF2812 domain-containing protein n=1 Tax=Proteiniclasticum sp. TaxID=2053595 RepID=UPI0028999E1B|nr:DUF2812 domain-containing protein [Proteiniclasticum sp.]